MQGSLKIIAVSRDASGLDPVYRSALARDLVILVVPADPRPEPPPVPPLPR